MKRKVFLVSIGMDGAETLTAQARAAIESAQLLIGAQRMLAPFQALGKPCLTLVQSGEIEQAIRGAKAEHVAVLLSGDGGFYSGAKKLLPLLAEWDNEVICGISSPVYFCGRLKIQWQDVHFVSLHGKEASPVRTAASFEKVFFLLGGDACPKGLCQTLCEYGMGEITVHIGENLGYESERIVSGKASEFVNLEMGSLCVLLTENANYERGVRSGIPDEEFVRGNVPMTKAEVRSVVVSKLQVKETDICWDIGSGTGSVSIEMALQCRDGRVYAVEKNEEALRLTDENRRRFQCDNIEIRDGNAVGQVEKLPPPDCVFIGGSSGEMGEIVRTVFRMNPSARLVVTAVSIETIGESVRLLEEQSLSLDVVQISVTRTKKIGSHTMLQAQNPVYIITGCLPFQ